MDSYLPVLFIVFLALSLMLRWWSYHSRRRIRNSDVDSEKEKQSPTSPYRDIEPLDSFDWRETKPIQIRVFKPKFHLTMALENCAFSEFLTIDDTYLDRVKLRQSIMDEHSIQAYQSSASCEPAVFEMYEWMFGTYLPKRFPTMFKIVNTSQIPSDSKIDGSCLYNIPTGEYIPLKASSAEQALYTLGKNVDDDILILLPSSEAEDGSPIYHLEAYVCCFPAGFSLPQKFRLPLASIHTPVPGYKEKLEKSMDRFFAKLELGKAVRRFNWSITTSTQLFLQSENHLYAGGKTASENGVEAGRVETASDAGSPELEESISRQKKDVKIENCRLRCERQTLHRLEKTKAIVFAFKTYQHRLEDIKAEGSGPALAEAIDGLTKGTVPDMVYYKRGVVWGDKVREYLLS